MSLCLQPARPAHWRNAAALALIAAAVPGGAGAAPADNPSPAESMAVSVVTAKNACFRDSLQLTGTIVAREEVFVRPEQEELQVAAILAEDGAYVRTGQPLAQLTRPDWLPGGPARATLTSPADGTLLYRRLAVGTPASAQGEPMFRIVRNGELELLTGLPQDALAKVKPGQAARIELLDSSQASGAVRTILPQIDPLTQIGQARIEVRGGSGARPGAFATVTIDLGQSCGVSAPLSAILYGPHGAIVQVVRDNRIETRRVSVGLFSGFDAEIREGLAAGDAVVARAGSFLREGDLVRPTP